MGVWFPAVAPMCCRSLGVILLVAASIASTAHAADPKRVLLVHTYSRDSAPFAASAAALRDELARRSPEPVAFYDTALEFGRPGGPESEALMVDALRARFANTRLALVVTIGAVATRFYERNRDQLFAGVPVLAFAVEERNARGLALRPGDAVVGTQLRPTAIVDTIRTLLPGTRSVAVIMGDSPLERFWVEQFRGEFAALGDKLAFEWMNGMPLPQIKARIASLPRDAVVFYGLFAVDAAGAPQDERQLVNELRAASAVPMFGLFESELGAGVVGGPLLSERRLGALAAERAALMLSGDVSAAPAAAFVPPGTPAFDWRELRRFDIPEGRLPAGSVVKFRPPSIWTQYRRQAVAGLAIMLLQAALIVALIAQHRRLRRAQRESLATTGRMMSAREDERRRLARELHDDVSQRLARLAIDAAQLDARGAAARGQVLHGELARLGEDVHALSYRLHPSILDDLGLAEALKAECEQVARHAPLRVEVDVRDVPKELPADAALCIFRVAQEALRNVSRHAGAGTAKVSLRQQRGGLTLSVSDDGVGFDPREPRIHHGLGHAGMRERVRLLGGRIDVESARGRGTTVIAHVPIGAAA